MLAGKHQLKYTLISCYHLSRVMRKPDFCQCETKGADQLCSNCTADQRLCFHYTDTSSTIPLLLLSKISSFFTSSVIVQATRCQIWSETPKTSFLTSQLILSKSGPKVIKLLTSAQLSMKFQLLINVELVKISGKP